MREARSRPYVYNVGRRDSVFILGPGDQGVKVGAWMDYDVQ